MKPFKSLLGALVMTPLLASAQLEPQSQGDVRYLCGGVGLSEQQEMKAAARQYDAMLTFAAQSGQYLADVDVEIRNRRGDVLLSARCDGPIMLVDLPAAGQYQVTAQANGQERRTTVTTGGQGRSTQAVLVWPTPPGAQPQRAS
jgi:hypothetical protein